MNYISVKLLYVNCKKQSVCMSSNGSLSGDAIMIKKSDSFTIFQTIRFGGSLLYLFLRSKRYLAASVLRFMNVQVSGIDNPVSEINLCICLCSIFHVKNIYFHSLTLPSSLPLTNSFKLYSHHFLQIKFLLPMLPFNFLYLLPLLNSSSVPCSNI